jgi:hypothetical protein
MLQGMARGEGRGFKFLVARPNWAQPPSLHAGVVVQLATDGERWVLERGPRAERCVSPRVVKESDSERARVSVRQGEVWCGAVFAR